MPGPKLKTPKKGQSGPVNTLMKYIRVNQNSENLNPNNIRQEPKKEMDGKYIHF